MDALIDSRKASLFGTVLDRAVKTNPFGNNAAGDRAYRRAERIIAGIFLLTNHIGAEEPLRGEIRKAATDILPKLLSLRESMRVSASRGTNDLEAGIRNLISLVKMLVFSGLVSPQNAEAITDALDDLGNSFAVAQRSALSENIRFSREDLLDVREEAPSSLKNIKDKNLIKDKSFMSDTSLVHVQRLKPTSRESARARGIKEVLGTQGELGIRDIAAHLPEYSEKMIQRELVSLVRGGVVKKSGLKRWSRYSLARDEE